MARFVTDGAFGAPLSGPEEGVRPLPLLDPHVSEVVPQRSLAGSELTAIPHKFVHGL